MDREGQKDYKLFQDSVHGVMRFHPVIVKFIDTIAFQRLRNIKQLGTAYLVFPAAAHNRFEHSLGVCFLAGEVMDELEKNSPAVWKGIFHDRKEAQTIKLAIQIAGLLHDLGHGPFSHTWEVFVQACGVQDWDHEKTSCALIDLMLWNGPDLSELGKLFKNEFQDMDKYVKFIKDVIMGVTPDKIADPKRAFLYQIVANKFNDIDVDKYDYFLRDAQHLKMNIPFDYQRLIKLCRIEYRGDTSHIAFRDVENYSIQGMFRTRADLHIRAYQHRVVKNLEIMLIDALKEADKNEFRIGNLPLSRVHENPLLFSKLTDSIQETLLYGEDPKLESTRKILERLLTRDLYKTVAEWRVKVSRTDEEEKTNRVAKGLTRKLLNELEKDLDEKFALTQVCVNQGKYYDPLANVKFFAKHGKTVVERTVPDIKMDLPYYKLLIFQRGKEEQNLDEMKMKVQRFLEEKGHSLIL